MDKLKISCNSLNKTASERKKAGRRKGGKEERKVGEKEGRRKGRKEERKGFPILVLHKGEWESLKETVV